MNGDADQLNGQNRAGVAVAEHGCERALPEPINRTTRRGSDQYVLGCSVREFADPVTFANIERIERDNKTLRDELAWKLGHGTKRNRKWVRSRLLIAAYLFIVASAYTGWLFSSNGRVFRVAFAHGWSESPSGAAEVTHQNYPFIGDIPQPEIDSIVAGIVAREAEEAR